MPRHSVGILLLVWCLLACRIDFHGAPPYDQPVVPVNVAGKEYIDDHCNPQDYRLALNQGRDKPGICGEVLIHWRFLFEPRISRDIIPWAFHRESLRDAFHDIRSMGTRCIFYFNVMAQILTGASSSVITGKESEMHIPYYQLSEMHQSPWFITEHQLTTSTQCRKESDTLQ